MAEHKVLPETILVGQIIVLGLINLIITHGSYITDTLVV